MPSVDLSDKKAILGRSEKNIEKYGEKGTGFLGKVVMSSGENPVLGRQVLIDLASPHLILICGKRGGGKCLEGDTEIVLEDGSVKKIKDLEFDSQKILSMNSSYKIKPAEKSGFYKRTVSKLLEITLQSGKKIKLTPEHPLLTIDGWKPAQELASGNKIATPRKINIFGKEFLRECEIKLLAYLLAEGHTKRKAVWFTNSDNSIVEEFKLAVSQFDPNLETKKMDKYCLRVVRNEIERLNPKNKHKLREFLKSLGAYEKLAVEKTIPEKVLMLPKQKIALFLNRLFSCDGSIYFESNRWRLSYSSASNEMAKQVHHLLLRFGIVSKLRDKKTMCSGKAFGSKEIVINGENVARFVREIGFFGKKEEKQKIAMEYFANTKRNPNLDTIPKEIWNHYRPKNWAEIGRAIGYKYPKALCESVNYSPSRQKLLQIAKLDNNKLIEQIAASDIYWDSIKETKELNGEFTVYDFSVDENHNFLANDIIVHNSYSLAVMLEEFGRLSPEIKNRVSVIAIDTVGIFWSLKIPDSQNLEELEKWNLKPEMTESRVLVPQGKLDFYKEKGIPVDGAFTLKASELDAVEWMALFRLTWKDAEGILITRVVEELKEKMGTYFGIDEIIAAIKKDNESDLLSKQALISRMNLAKSWGLIEKEGTKIKDLAKPGKITIIDVSAYRQAIGMEGTRDIIVALLGKKLFEERMLYRKEEEIKLIRGEKRESSMPIIWMLIDEAHMFMPKDEDNIALRVLLEWVRVGRQPGLSLVLATQRPNKLHPDAISQCDLFISHRLTSQPDIMSVSELRPTYMSQDLGKYYSEMPRGNGYALVIDDNTEKIWMIKMRPRMSWDASVTASAFLK